MNGLDNQEQVLLELCRAELRPTVIRSLLDRSPFELDRFLETAREHRLSAYALDRLAGLAAANGTVTGIAALARREIVTVYWANLAFKRELERLRAALAASGIDCLVLKGLSLNFSGLRSMGDLDLLVPAASIVQAIQAVLSIQGYCFRLRAHPWDSDGETITLRLSEAQKRRVVAQEGWNSEYQLFNQDLGVLVELHTRLLQAPPDGYSPIYGECAAVQDGVEYFWQRKVYSLDLNCSVLAPEHSLLLMCLHTALKRAPGRWFRLSNVVDIDNLSSGGLDWDEVLRAAQRFRVCHLVEFSLRLAQSLIGSAVPAEVMDGLAAGGSRSRRMAAGLRFRGGLRALNADSSLSSKLYVVITNYLNAGSVWERLRWALLLPILFPSRHRLASILLVSPTSPFLPFAYLLQPARWLWKAGRGWSRRCRFGSR